MGALPFCRTRLRAGLPLPQGYPKQLVTIADHLRKRRLDLGLSQSQAAKKMGVSPASVLHWELGQTLPELRFLRRIWAFLGQVVQPGSIAADEDSNPLLTLGERLCRARRHAAMTQQQLARQLGVDPCTIQAWETGRHQPQEWLLCRLREFLCAESKSTQRHVDEWP